MIHVDPIREYIDVQIKAPARRYGRRWCHLEDSESDTERLHAFARRIGIPRSWFQVGANGRFPHYDLTPRYRSRAVQAGAVQLDHDQSSSLTHWKAQTNRHFPKGDARYGKKLDKNGRAVGSYSRPRRDILAELAPVALHVARVAPTAHAEALRLPGIDAAPEGIPDRNRPHVRPHSW